MSHNDCRRGREIAELARLLPVPGGRDLPAGREQTLKEHLMTELHGPHTAGRPAIPDRRGKRRRRLGAVAGAGVLAAALTASAVAGGNALFRQATPTSHPGRAAVTGIPATPAALLAKIADAAAKQAAPAVTNGEFMYIRSEVAYSVDTVTNGSETSVMEKLHERQIWLPVANICDTGLLIEDGSRTPLSPYPVVDGKVDRTPPSGDQPRPNFTCPSEGHLGDVTYRLLQSLPTKPAALLAYLRAGRKWTNDDPATEIGDLIRENIVPPAVAAALYRVAAQLPGATLVPDATNAVGQHGVGIAWTSTSGGNQYRTEWIFSKTTLQYIGERDYNVSTDAVDGESAIQQRAFVGKAGQLP
jgi:hypothetical protein